MAVLCELTCQEREALPCTHNEGALCVCKGPILNQKASPFNPGGSCGFDQSEVPCHRVNVLENPDLG